MCLCELDRVSQTAGLGLSRSRSAVCECLVSQEGAGGGSPPFPPSVLLFKQLEACQNLQGCEDNCSLCDEKSNDKI